MDSAGYSGESRSAVGRVYGQAVYGSRSGEATVEDISRRTRTHLDHEVVASIMDAAKRLLPIDRTPEGTATRKEKDEQLAKAARNAEWAFLRKLLKSGYSFQMEFQQRGLPGGTPDVRFLNPTPICGHLCHWLEFKNFFGFRKNPFVARRNVEQLSRYAYDIGPGAVVYKLGFEADHIEIEGVRSLREREVLESLTNQRGDEVGSARSLWPPNSKDSSADKGLTLEEESGEAGFVVSTGRRKNRPSKKGTNANTDDAGWWTP